MPGLEARVITDRLVEILDEAFQGASGPTTYFVDNRADSGLFGALAGLKAADASRDVAGKSIAAHVHHVAFALEASSDWIAGDRTPQDWNASWRLTTVDDQTWALLLERLRRDYRDLRAATESTAGTDKDAFVESVSAIAHVAYHLGSVWQKLAILRER